MNGILPPFVVISTSLNSNFVKPTRLKYCVLDFDLTYIHARSIQLGNPLGHKAIRNRYVLSRLYLYIAMC